MLDFGYIKPYRTKVIYYNEREKMNSIEKLKKYLSDPLLMTLILFLYPFVYSLTFNQTKNFFSYPLVYGEDGVLTLSVIKGILQNGWYLQNKYLAAPFIQLHYDFPIPDMLFLGIIKLLGFFNFDHFTIYNLFFYLSYSMVGLSSFIVLRKLGLSRQLSLAGSFMFAFLPYHQIRLNHLFLANYFSIPIFIYYAFKCFESRIPSSTKSQVVPILLLIISAASGVYYAFFGGLFIFFAGILAWKCNSNWVGFKKSIAYSALILVTVIVTVAPNIAWKMTNEKNPVIGKRIFAESEMYGLKLAQLVLPTQSHRFDPFAYLNLRYSSVSPNVNENAGSSLGLLGAIGFIGLLILLFNPRNSSPIQYLVSRLNFLGFMFATVGGGGLLFAFFITPQFRALNRISTFIGFMSILYFCILTEKLLEKVDIKKITKSSILWVSSIFIIAFSNWDQISPQHTPGIVHGYAMFDSNELFFRELEKTLPVNSMVYMLPYARYPESPMAFKEGYYALLRPYLHTDTIRWSHGQMGYTNDDAWIAAVASAPIEKQLLILKEFSFNGILIDRHGLEDGGAALEKKINLLTKAEPSISPDKRFSFFSISNYEPAYTDTETSGVVPIFQEDWYAAETDGKAKWLWSGRKRSKIIFQKFNRKPTTCLVRFNLQVSGPSKVTVKSTDVTLKPKTYDFSIANSYDITMNLNIESTGSNITFESDTKPVQIDAINTRQVSFRIIDLSYCGQKF
jgi:phosphoglycerol transferase